MFSSIIFNNNDDQILHKLANYVTHNTDPNRKILWYCDGDDGDITIKLWEYIYRIPDDSSDENTEDYITCSSDGVNDYEISDDQMENIADTIIGDDMFTFDIEKLKATLNQMNYNNAIIDEKFYCHEHNIIDDFDIIDNIEFNDSNEEK
jgi:hypothetical protein